MIADFTTALTPPKDAKKPGEHYEARDAPPFGTTAAKERLLARYSRASGLLWLFLDELALDKDLDFLADDKPAIEYHVECQAEVPAVDPAFGVVANAVAHHGIIEFS